MLNIIDRDGHGAFVIGRDAVSHFIRRQTSKIPYCGDDGDANIGKNIDRGTHYCQRSENQQQYRQNHEGIRAIQCNTYDPHVGRLGDLEKIAGKKLDAVSQCITPDAAREILSVFFIISILLKYGTIMI